ncbi:MAG: response regulator [Chloroflexota bacterium]|nr:MAG: response regulator [Chloroflexota bacterium]
MLEHGQRGETEKIEGAALRVLIVEDSEDDALLVMRALRQAGYDPAYRRVDTREAMVAELEKGDWEVVVSDYVMPSFSGLAALSLLKERGVDLPFIVVSGKIGEETAVEAMKAGAHDCVTKDKLARLAPAIRRELSEAAERRARQLAEEERAKLDRGLREANERLVRAAQEAQEATAREHALRQRIAAERARLEAVLQQLPSAVMIAEAPSGKLIMGNEQLERMWRHLFLAPAEIGEYREWKGFHADGRPYRPEEWPLERSIRGGQTVTDEEIHFVRADGTRGTMSVSSAPIRDGYGRIVAGVVVFTDVTERKKAEEALRKTHDELEARVGERTAELARTNEDLQHEISERRKVEQLREEYISLVSHDLRSPLSNIIGSTEWLMRTLGQKGMEAESRWAATVLKNAKRMNLMIQELVDSARLESGRARMQKVPTVLGHLVPELVERVGTLEDRSRIRVEADEPMPSVLVDPEHIERAIVNLLTNALKYSPAESPVVMRVARRNNDVLVTVTDQGVGIPPEDIPHLFQRYYRSKTAVTQEGLGLGLYIARLIVEAHGGRIWVESELEKGSTFGFALPLG